MKSSIGDLHVRFVSRGCFY